MKSLKLKFKGSVEERKESKRVKRAKHNVSKDDNSSIWITATSLPLGPTVLMSTQTDTPSVLFAHPESTKISFRQQDDQVSAFEPSEVHQVFLVTLLPGSKELYSIKAFNDKYLGCDAHGVCSCTREAIGHQEEFRIEQVEGGFAFLTMYNTYLSIDLAKTTVVQEDGLGVLIQQVSKMSGVRGDATEINALSTVMARCQAGYSVNKALIKDDAEEGYAVELIKRYSTQNTRNLKFTDDHIETFKKAKAIGNLNETLLNQRETLKADKFCK